MTTPEAAAAKLRPRSKRTPRRKKKKPAAIKSSDLAEEILPSGPTPPPPGQSPSAARHVALRDSAAILPQSFFLVDALDLAPRLLGKLLRRDDVVLRITEVEAYRPNDTACHGRFGLTARTAPVFGPGGHAYVYLCYGLHMMLNIVADKEGAGAAVLIRSCAPVNGMETIQERRRQKTEKPILLTGPGKFMFHGCYQEAPTVPKTSAPCYPFRNKMQSASWSLLPIRIVLLSPFLKKLV